MKFAATMPRRTLVHDLVLISIMATLAACGLIYEYLLSHYAGRILGLVETTIYTMIGLMIVSMGLGALAAKAFKDPFTAFAWLETLIALIGVSCILLIASAISFSSILPDVIAEIFNLPPDLTPRGGLLARLHNLGYYTPYIFGLIIGFLIGMEIPLIARVREAVYGKHLEHNVGTIYGADYMGAGFGAAIWVLVMLSIEITRAAVFTASANLLAGLIFLYCYWGKIRRPLLLLCLHGVLLLFALLIYKQGDDWVANMTNLLFEDEVIYAGSSRYQHFTITERRARRGSVLNFFVNGRLQFSEEDEHIYHSMLVYPAMMLAPEQANVLIIGGGDGLAARDVLRFNPRKITLIDLDQALVDLFSMPDREGDGFRSRLAQLNEFAFSDQRLDVVYSDAFTAINIFLENNAYFDAIIVDLPDPSHPNLNRLYSDHFYRRLHQLLRPGGAMVVQSTSPYHAKSAFISIGKTIDASGFSQVAQYHQNVPTFGQWGWTLAIKSGAELDATVRRRLAAFDRLPVEHHWLTRDLLIASFEFPNGFFALKDKIKVNHLGSNQIYQYHDQAWRGDLGIYRD